MKVAVIYWSQTGNTEAMANAVADGARAKGADVDLIVADGSDVDVTSYDGVALGCPAMGAEELEDSEFQPTYDSLKGSLAGKKVALFGSYGWGDGEWMRTWEADAKDAGLTLVCDCVIANEAPDDEAEAACRALGAALV